MCVNVNLEETKFSFIMKFSLNETNHLINLMNWLTPLSIPKNIQ